MEYATSTVFGIACFDHHRAEITVMQFTGHPLPVHQFVTVPWDFNPVPYCQSSSPTPTEYATSAVFGMACLAKPEVNIQQKKQHYWKRPVYWEESWRLEETGCHSSSSEKPSANTDVNNSKGVNNNNNNLELTRELKKLWNMKVTIVPIVIGALATITKGLLKGLEDLEVGWRVETIQSTACWERPESWEESWRLEETCCHSDSSEKPSANADVKNSKGVNNNNNNNNNGTLTYKRIT